VGESQASSDATKSNPESITALSSAICDPLGADAKWVAPTYNHLTKRDGPCLVICSSFHQSIEVAHDLDLDGFKIGRDLSRGSEQNVSLHSPDIGSPVDEKRSNPPLTYSRL
jgi:hypothetical protein